MPAEKYIPQKLPDLKERKSRFEGVNEFVHARHGWITSIPGEREVTMECLPDSTLPAELRELGYDVRSEGEGERILHSAIIEKFVAGADGAFAPLTVGSTLPVVMTTTHAGIVKVKRYTFDLDR